MKVSFLHIKKENKKKVCLIPTLFLVIADLFLRILTLFLVILNFFPLEFCIFLPGPNFYQQKVRIMRNKVTNV